MKKILIFTILSILIPSFLNPTYASYDDVLTLSVPPKFDAKICNKDKWNPIKISWYGIRDMRKSKIVATMQKKNGSPYKYASDKPVVSLFEEYIPSVFRKCGLYIVSPGEKSAYKVRARLKEFSANMSKDLIKTEIQAKSRIELSFENRFSTVIVDIGYIMESKSPNFRNKKKLQKIINALLAGTLEELSATDQIEFLKP